MLTTVDHLKESIANLEKEAPDSRLLKDFKEQLTALEYSAGKSAEQLYYSGNPVVPTSPPVTAATDSTAASQQGPLPALNLPPDHPMAAGAVARREEWLKKHPPEPISPEVEQQVRDLM